MLNVKNNRLDYGKMLIPPSGYRLARAVAATYTLDLNTLLSIPVALFFSQTLEGNFEAERVQLLEAIQRCPEYVKVYHQKGKIHVPKKHNKLYGLLEPCVAGILPKDAFTSFHPKVWVLQYKNVLDETVRYRVIVLSRNLTYDRSWDIAVHLDGEVTDRRQPKNKPLVDFVDYLNEQQSFDGHKAFVKDLRRVEFETPAGFNNKFTFHPVGLDGYPNPIKEQTASNALCISPFVHDKAITTIEQNVSEELLLLGCHEELRRLKPSSLDDVRTFCLSDWIVDGESKEQVEDGEGEPCKQNLHAKLYVYKNDSTRNIWFIGSANATQAAFDRNIEFLLELRGRSSSVQLDQLKDDLLGEDEKGGMFERYERPEEKPDDSDQKKLEEQLRRLEFQLLNSLEVKSAEVKRSENESNFDLFLSIHPGKMAWKGLNVKVAPFNSDGVTPRPLKPQGTNELAFRNISESNLSRFLKFEIWKGGVRHRQFLMKVQIEGIPDSRIGNILRSIIKNRDRFFEYLRFLLADDLNKDPVGHSDEKNGKGRDGGSFWDTATPIYEQLLLAASRSPKRLKAIDEIIVRLQQEELESDEDDRIVPEEFLMFWEAFKQVASVDAGETDAR
ncbi:phospholipase D family protein [bacterium]|nr:phospholipase D family protein [bacterium]